MIRITRSFKKEHPIKIFIIKSIKIFLKGFFRTFFFFKFVVDQYNQDLIHFLFAYLIENFILKKASNYMVETQRNSEERFNFPASTKMAIKKLYKIYKYRLTKK